MAIFIGKIMIIQWILLVHYFQTYILPYGVHQFSTQNISKWPAL